MALSRFDYGSLRCGNSVHQFWKMRRKIAFSSSPPASLSSYSMVKILDLSSHQVSTLPGSEHTRSLQRSPDGRFISVAFAGFGSAGLKVFDLGTQRWSVLREAETIYARWSRDSQFIYFVTYYHDLGVYLIRISGGDAERLVDLTDFRYSGLFGLWFDLDPAETPMLLRDVGTFDICGITLETQ